MADSSPTTAGSFPHTRGARTGLADESLPARIIPAYAGSTPVSRSGPGSARDHPRIRGEHMSCWSATVTLPGSSPHTRGARPFSCRYLAPTRIIPAYAGSTGQGLGELRVGWDHPRIRGEHVEKAGETSLGTGSSPHTRGAPLVAYAVRGRHGIIPAYAGSTHGRAGELWRRGDHPRIRGEHAGSGASGLTSKGSSPHTRGARHRTAAPCARPRIIPAYAGSTLETVTCAMVHRDHPRIRGEHTAESVFGPIVTGSSPHTRGARRALRDRLLRAGIIPAYAGSTGACCSPPRGCGDHPRIRGEHPRRRASSPWRSGSSPHTRGALDQEVRDMRPRGIIPAYAGSTSRASTARRCARDHPRIRGEHPRARRSELCLAGSSPHTRGAHQRGVLHEPAEGIIPAYAGSTRQSRISIVSLLGSSPHTRGAPLSPHDAAPVRGIIPAYAGSTRRRSRRGSRPRDHPRIRGEHVRNRGGGSMTPGSSPHTRGAPLSPSVTLRWSRIIPAYAGSTSRASTGSA